MYIICILYILYYMYIILYVYYMYIIYMHTCQVAKEHWLPGCTSWRYQRGSGISQVTSGGLHLSRPGGAALKHDLFLLFVCFPSACY